MSLCLQSYVVHEGMSKFSQWSKIGDRAVFAVNPEKFMEHIVTYQDFVNNPGIIEDPSLVICINAK